MKKYFDLAATGLLLLAVTVGCASAIVEGRRDYTAGEQISRPGRILVYDFVASADDMAPSSAITGRYGVSKTPQSAKQIRLGREMGRRVADELVKDILQMGLPAERERAAAPPSVGDVVISGEFVHIDEGSRIPSATGS